MEYGVLGPLRVLAAGCEIRVAGLLSQRILAMLLMNPNRIVTFDRLADAAWGRDAPSTARRQIQNRVAALRATLVPGGAHLLTHAVGYSLAVQPGELDMDVFERHVSSAGACADVARRTAMLQQALHLWRGPALDGLGSLTLAPAAQLLNEKRLQVLGDYLELKLQAGCHEEIIPELAMLRVEHPHKERFLAQWMIAVAAAGRRAEALDAYHEFRAHSIEQRGVEPGQELTQTYLNLLREEPTAASKPGAVIPRQLPRRASSLIARDREFAELSAQLADPAELPVIIIHGAGGIGKTTLALHAAHAMAERFSDGQLYIDLHGFTPGRHALSTANVLGNFLRALGLRGDDVPSDPEEAAALFRSVIAGRRVLLVLDNAREQAQVAPLLPGSAGCAVIITSRRVLPGIEGAYRIGLRPFSTRDAVRLLTQEIGGRLIADEPAAASAIADLCGGMPLALRIAASRSHPGMPLHSLASSLADASLRLDHLELPETGVRASISASHHVLRDSADPLDNLAERGLLAVSLLDGPDVSRTVVQALFPESGTQVERAFERLVDASLIDKSEPGRYRMHDLVRLYGREQISGEPAARAILTRAFGVYVATAWNAAELIRPGDSRRRLACRWWSDSAMAFPNSSAALDWSEAERENIMAAIRQSGMVSGIPVVIPVQLAVAMFGFFRVRGYWNDAIEAGRAGMEAARRAGDRRAASFLQSDVGRALVECGDLSRAEKEIESAIRSQRDIGDREGLAQSLGNMGVVCFEDGRLGKALGCYLDSLSIHRQVCNLRGQAMTLDNMGLIYRRKRFYGKAFDCHNRALSIFRDLDDSYGQAVALEYIGELYFQIGKSSHAVSFLEKGLSIFRRMGDRNGEAESLLRIGSVLRAQRQYDEALRAHECAVVIIRNAGLSMRGGMIAEALRETALTLKAAGRDAEAMAYARQAEGVHSRVGDPVEIIS